MPQYLAPGVYVEEVDAGPAPIAGVGTSTAGFVGMTRRGPVVGRPALVTSWAQYVRTFGGFLDLGPAFAGADQLPYAVRGFFANGGRRLYVMRVLAAAGTSAAQVEARGGAVTRLTEDTKTTGPGTKVLRLASLRGIRNGTKLQLRMTRESVVTDSAVLTVASYDPTANTVTLSADVSTTTVFSWRHTVVLTDASTLDANGAVTALASPTTARPTSITLTASSAGSWGRDVVVNAFAESAASSVLAAMVVHGVVDGVQIRLASGAGFYDGAWVEIDQGNAKTYRRVVKVTGAVLTLAGPALAAATAWDPGGGATHTRVSTCEFGLSLEFDGLTETHSGLTLANVPGRYYATRLASSSLLRAAVPPPGEDPLRFPVGDDGVRITLTGGSDGAAPPTPTEVRGTDGGPNARTGVHALGEVDEIAIVAAPGLTDQVVQNALVEQCERLKDRFAVLDPVAGATIASIQDQAALYDTSYAALYYPRVVVDDALTGGRRTVAPSGHLVGIYARVDDTRGVHKAPANEVLRDVLDLESAVTKGEQEVLNPRGINVLRDFRAERRGLRVYGARTLSSATPWVYVNVRRLFIFVEESLDEGTQWVVFEPNDHRLWARVVQTASIFLTRVWRDGALMGRKAEEAFFVRCDETTNSDDDVLNGRLVMEIGIAPVRPAEFVVIRIGQWLGGSAVQEL